MEEVIIIGSGPAGLTAGIYTARANLKPLIIAGSLPGGQLMTTTVVENYPGFRDGIDGPVLMGEMRAQAERFGARFVDQESTGLEVSGSSKKVLAGGNTYEARTVIVATGARSKTLGVPGEKEYWGRGVSTCATCDAAFYRDKIVAVVGGGDSAAEEALFLTRFAAKVHIIVRRGELRASKIMKDRILNNSKINVIWNTKVLEVLGGATVTGIKLFNVQEEHEHILPANGFFLAIGHEPETVVFGDTLEKNPEGYLLKNIHLKHPNPDLLKYQNATGIPGVFVAGDVEDHVYRQAITAAAEGCKAAIDAERYLESL